MIVTNTLTCLIALNVAPVAAHHIGAYDANGDKIGLVDITGLNPDYGQKLYSFGILSDVHQKYNTQDSENINDLRNALTYFTNTEGVEFTVICGDLTQNQGKLDVELTQYSNVVAQVAGHAPIYPTTGNHDCPNNSTSVIDIELFKAKTGIAEYFTGDTVNSYEITKQHQTAGGTTVTDHFLFLGMHRWYFTSGTYHDTDITWLGNKLEAYKNDRCFVITHMFFPDASGNFGGYYPSGNHLSGTQLTALKALRDAYPRAVWFSGHSHWKWYLQGCVDGNSKSNLEANVYPTSNVNRTCGWAVHIPSCASPIDSKWGANQTSSDRDETAALPQSEGGVIDVYEDRIVIRGLEFKGISDSAYANRYVPVAQYLLCTDPE